LIFSSVNGRFNKRHWDEADVLRLFEKVIFNAWENRMNNSIYKLKMPRRRAADCVDTHQDEGDKGSFDLEMELNKGWWR
jgi:hypothetical protein